MRLVLGALLSFLLVVMALALVPRDQPGWRIGGIAIGILLAVTVASRLRTRVEPAAQAPSALPGGLESQIPALVTHAVEHADRNAVAWATIAVTAHSLTAIALSKVDRADNQAEVATALTIYAVAFLVLASISLPGAHAISTSAARAQRAVAVAREDPKLGPLYTRVFPDEPKAWQTDLLGITLNAFGTIWLCMGLLMVALGLVLNVI